MGKKAIKKNKAKKWDIVCVCLCVYVCMCWGSNFKWGSVDTILNFGEKVINEIGMLMEFMG